MGKDKVDHPPGFHDDLANAVAGAVVLASHDRAWTTEEQSARMPMKSEHRTDRFMSPSLAAGRRREEIRREADAEMDEWLRGQGCSRPLR